MNETWDQLEQSKEVMKWELPQTQGQDRRVLEALDHGGLVYEFEDQEEDLIEEIGKFAPRRRRHEEVDWHLGNMKINILSFQGRNEPQAYLEWEKKIEMLFDYHHYF